MRNRFYVNGDLAAGSVVSLSEDERHHARVLRVGEGEEVEVFNGRGDSFAGSYTADGVRLTSAAPNREAPVRITLAMAIINLEKFELVLQKATELGVAAMIPLVTDRCEVRPERYRGKHERWEKIVFEAVKQSGRSRIPVLEEPTKFDDVIARPGTKIFFDMDAPSEGGRKPPHSMTLFIGPEGGWSERELRTAHESGCAFEQLGPRRLRAETAAIVATALVIGRHS